MYVYENLVWNAQGQSLLLKEYNESMCEFHHSELAAELTNLSHAKSDSTNVPRYRGIRFKYFLKLATVDFSTRPRRKWRVYEERSPLFKSDENSWRPPFKKLFPFNPFSRGGGYEARGPLFWTPVKNRGGRLPLKSHGTSNGWYFGTIIVKFDLPVPNPKRERIKGICRRKKEAPPSNNVEKLWWPSPVETIWRPGKELFLYH